MTGSRKRARSNSGDLDSDGDYDEDNHVNQEDNNDGSQPGRSGGKKNNSSRRDQNRIAQREFRLRKQQRIRDLEAHVKVLSESKDEAFIQMREMLRALKAENGALRKLVRNLSSFIGEGVGGVLPSLGWTVKEFEVLINKADSDTAFAALAKRWKAKEEEQLRKTGQNQDQNQNQNQDHNHNHNPNHTQTHNHNQDQNHIQTQGSPSNPILIAEHPSAPTDIIPDDAFASYCSESLSILLGGGGPYSSEPLNGLHETSLTNGFLGGGGPPHLDFSPSPLPLPPAASNGRQSSFPSYQHPTHTLSPAAAGPSFSHHTATSSLSDVSIPSEEFEGVAVADQAFNTPKIQNACDLITYHLNNFRRNPVYCLPASLRPTLVQRTVDHESIIDEIPHPEIRNRMILMKGHFNLLDCITKYFKHTEIHGDDVLAHTNWEIHETWLKEFGFLVDAGTLAIVNRWRKERGERDLTMPEIYSNEHVPSI